MTDAPHRIWLHKMPTGIMQANYAISDTHDSSGQVEYIRLDLHEAAVSAARAEGMREAARIGGDAAVAVLLRHEPDASPLRQQAARQAIAVPIFHAAEGQK